MISGFTLIPREFPTDALGQTFSVYREKDGYLERMHGLPDDIYKQFLMLKEYRILRLQLSSAVEPDMVGRIETSKENVIHISDFGCAADYIFPDLLRYTFGYTVIYPGWETMELTLMTFDEAIDDVDEHAGMQHVIRSVLASKVTDNKVRREDILALW